MVVSFEILQTIINASVPVLLAVFGYMFNRQLKNIEQNQWQNRKVVEMRLDLYQKLAPSLNDMLCFCMWVGNWKKISPEDMLSLKRETDKTVNVYRFLFSKQFYQAYDDFIRSIFQTFNGPGLDAKLRCEISGVDGDRRAALGARWNDSMERLFSTHDLSPKGEIELKYVALMEQFRLCIGLKGEEPA